MTNVTRVTAVVPVYFPDPDLVPRLAIIRAQVDQVVVVDDGTSGESAEVVAAIDLDGVLVVRHSHNQGIAAALNSGVAAALEDGADYVLTVDQDTRLPADYVDACVAVFERAAASTLRVGVVAAGGINGAPVLPHASEEGIDLMRYAIQSGMLISAECFHRCGDFDERLVIDVVDTEFCLRVWANGMVVAAALGTDIDHELGLPMPSRVFGVRRFQDGVERTYEYHSPLRQYYISRNGFDVALRYLLTEPRWSISALRHDFLNFGVGFAAGPHRGRHALAASLGVLHGLVRRRGMLSPWWRRRLAVPTRSN